MPRIVQAGLLLAVVCCARWCDARALLSSSDVATTSPPEGVSAFSVSQAAQQQQVAPVMWGALLALGVLCPAQAVVAIAMLPGAPAFSSRAHSPPSPASPPHSPPPPPGPPHPPRPPHTAGAQQEASPVDFATLAGLVAVSFPTYIAVCWTPLGTVGDVALLGTINWLTHNLNGR